MAQSSTDRSVGAGPGEGRVGPTTGKTPLPERLSSTPFQTPTGPHWAESPAPNLRIKGGISSSGGDSSPCKSLLSLFRGREGRWWEYTVSGPETRTETLGPV